jgi:hypothetical protein
MCEMHRPVKNRDGGPIAGVAFNGGGGSRQLGPDDNDPVSATHFPEASNHTIPPSSTQPSTTLSHFVPELEMGVDRKTTLPKYPPSPPLSVLSSPLTERQNSPASESEDQCAACKGAGEFVCCEGCPRVFHLLCMDPPRMQVPDGSFYCHACSAGPPEEADPEDFIGLKTLFASLDRTNPRAFALPQEVQNRFEDVSARSDGSYYEEVKKFPL